VRVFFAHLPSCPIGLEACAGSHGWSRELMMLGLEVRLISPQLVKPDVNGNENNANDAEAIGEAVGQPNLRFMPVKSPEPLDMQMLHRVRQSLVKQRTALGHQTRGLLGEYGIGVAQGLSQLRKRLPEILEDAENGLSVPARAVFSESYDRLVELDRQVRVYEDMIQQVYQNSPAGQKLGAIPGIGPITATAMVAALGEGKHFENGRQTAAHGHRQTRDPSLRTLLIHPKSGS
jgi:transposase